MLTFKFNISLAYPKELQTINLLQCDIKQYFYCLNLYTGKVSWNLEPSKIFEFKFKISKEYFKVLPKIDPLVYIVI